MVLAMTEPRLSTQAPKTNLNPTGVVAAIMSAIAFSSMGIFAKMAYELGVQSMNLVAIRSVLAFLIVGAVLAVLRGRIPPLKREHWGSFLGIGFVGVALNYAAFFVALEYTSVTVTIALLFTFPAFVVIAAVFFLGEKFTLLKGIVILLTVTGCFLAVGGWDVAGSDLTFWGVFFGLGASLTKVVYTILSKRVLGVYDSWTTVFYSFGVGAVFLLAYMLVTAQLRLDMEPAAWGFILAITVVPTLFGYGLFVVALTYLQAGQASVIATLEPALAVLLAAILLAEHVAMLQVFGMALIVGGVVLQGFEVDG